MPNWNHTNFQLEADYFNGKSDRLTMQCRSLSLLPAVYGPDNVAADGAIMRSLIDRPSLLARGLERNKLGTIAWTRLLFKDPVTGAHKEFDIRVMDTLQPGTARFEILNEI
jgi:hypothetical protein